MKKARVAKQKAQQAKAKIKAAQPAAASPLPQAPLPETFTKNSFPKKASYIPGLYVPGNPEYKAEYGGGGWAAGVKEYDGPGFNSIEDLKTRFRELAASQSSSAGAPASGELTSTQPSSALGAAKEVKGLRGAGPVVSKGEFRNIMRSQGITAQQLLERAGRRGVALGAGVVNAANRGKLGGGSVFPYSVAGLGKEPSDFIQGMKGLTLSPGQQYSGTYQRDGVTAPIVQARSGAANLTGYSQPMQAGTAGEAVATSGGKVQKLLNKIQKTKALIKSSKSELAARGF